MSRKLLPHLEATRAALEANDAPAALRAALEAWRSARTPRLADLVDRLSAVVTPTRPFAKTKSVKARTEAVLAALKKKNELELGGVLEQPWPGKWQDAEPVLEAVCAQPPDPRVAVALARLIDAAPYDTWTTGRFWNRVLNRIVSLEDVRVVPILESAFERPRSSYFRDTKARIKSSIATLHAREPVTLAEAELAVVVAIEAHFATDVHRASQKSRGEAEMLAEIYARPDDLALRQVFADFLVERGDPRGEHIAIGLARREGRADAAALRKQAAIAKKHGASWIGELDRVLARDGRVFDAGFLKAATLELVAKREYRRATELPAALRSAALSTVTSLGFGREAQDPELFAEILSLPALAHLTELVNVPDEGLVTLGKLKPRALIRAIDVDVRSDEGREVLARGEALPALVDLTIEPNDDLAWLFASPAARKLERLAVRSYEWPLGAMRAAVERQGLALRELVFTERRHMRHEWWFSFTRGPDGKFSRLEGRSAGPNSVPSSYDLERALSGLATDSLASFVVPAHDVCAWASADIARAEAQLERFERTEISVPWRRPPRVVVRAGEPVTISLYGSDLAKGPHLGAVLEVVQAPPFSLVLDASAEDHKSHAPVEGPLEALVQKTFAKKRLPCFLHLYQEGARERSHVALSPSGNSLGVTSVVEDSKEAHAAWVAGLARLVEAAGDVKEGGVRFSEGEGHLSCRAISHLEVLGHVTVFGPDWLSVFPVEELRALEGRAKLPPIRVVEAGRAALFILGANSANVPRKAQHAALERAMAEILDRTFPRVRGYRLSSVAREHLDGPLAKLGLQHVVEDPLGDLLGDVVWRAEHPNGERRVTVEFIQRSEATVLRASMMESRLRPDDKPVTRHRYFAAAPSGIDHPAKTAAEVHAALSVVVRQIEADLPGWFDEPIKATSRRR
ncbi:MAG: TIGR02996 domain-containing protein [Polyangiaceae bacterium]